MLFRSCAMVHTYGVYSTPSPDRKPKVITWVPNPWRPVRHDPDADPNLVMVDPLAFKRAFSAGVERFLTSTLSDKEKKPLLEQRLSELITYLPFTFDT